MTVMLMLLAGQAQPVPAWGRSRDVRVVVDGAPLGDIARIRDNRVQVPMRPIFERLGAQVQWFPRSRKVVARRGGTTISLVVGENFAYLPEATRLDYPPRIVRGRIMVPLRFVTESLGGTARWDRRRRTAYIESGG